MSPPTLVELAQRTAIRNIGSITELNEVGDLPYHILRPILRKITNPEQLRLIESTSPQVAGADNGELWRAFIKRDIQQWEDKIIEPKNPASWSKVYRKLRKEDEAQRKVAEEQLKAALTKAQKAKDSRATNIVHSVIPRVPSSREKDRMLNDYKLGGESRSRFSAGPGLQALKNARTPAAKLAVIRKQTAVAVQNRQATRATPSRELSIQRGTVQRAPQSMVDGYQRTSTPKAVQSKELQLDVRQRARQERPIFLSNQRTTQEERMVRTAILKAKDEETIKEDRLRALTGSKAAGRPTPNQQRQIGVPVEANRSQAQASVSPRPKPASPAPVSMGRKRPASAMFLGAAPSKMVKR